MVFVLCGDQHLCCLPVRVFAGARTTVSVGADLSPKKLFAQPGFDTTIKSLTRLHIGTIFLDLGYSLLRVCDPKI